MKPLKCSLIAFAPVLAGMVCTLAARAQSAGPKQRVASLNQEIARDLQQQKPQLAIPLLRELVSLEPGNTEAQGNLGVLLFFQNNFSEAIPELRVALQQRPGLWRIQALLGIAEKRTGDLDAAQNDLGQAFPNLDDVKIQKQAGLELLEVHSAAGRLDQAIAVAAKLEAIAPEDPEVLFAAYQLSMQMVDQSLLNMTIAAPDSAQMHMMMAEQLVHQRNTAGAIAQYREAIRIDPRVPGLHFELAEQLKQTLTPASQAEAETEYRAELKVNQYDGKAWRALGELLAQRGDNDAAKDAYSKALAVHPTDADAQTDKAILLISSNQQKEALPLLEDAVKEDPTDIIAHYRLSLLYRQAGRAADAKREMEAYIHYKDLKQKLGKVFVGMQPPPDAPASSPKPDQKQ